MEAADLASGRRRRRKQRVRRFERKSAMGIATTRFGLALFGLMSVVLLVYCGLIWLQVKEAAESLGPYKLGMTEADARYQFGEPKVSRAAADIWIYANAGSQLSLRFAADGRLDRVTCIQQGTFDGSCPQELGVGIGSTEDDLIRQFGPPDAMRYDRDEKLARYGALGLTVRLRKLQVVGIEHTRATSTAGMITLALWRMLP